MRRLVCAPPTHTHTYAPWSSNTHFTSWVWSPLAEAQALFHPGRHSPGRDGGPSFLESCSCLVFSLDYKGG